LSTIKKALYWATERARLIAYKALGLPHLAYANAVWYPTCKKEFSGLERIQVDKVRFIANIKGHEDVESAVKKLSLHPLEQRRRSDVLFSLWRFWQKKNICLWWPAEQKNKQHYTDTLPTPKQGDSPNQWVLTLASTRTVFSQGLSGIWKLVTIKAII